MLGSQIRICRLVGGRRMPVAPFLRSFHHEFTQPEPEPKSKPDSNPNSTLQSKEESKLKRHSVNLEKHEEEATTSKVLTGAMAQKYKLYRDEDSTEIFDVEEERQRFLVPDESDTEVTDEYFGLNLERGVHGVFDIQDLVEVLRKENADDIFVCSLPKELKYVDYMVTCSGRSFRHMVAMAEFVRRMYKIKRSKNDILPKIEGEKSRDWMALDLGNIALHIFSPQAREEYDLESLWAIGPEYDKECNKRDMWSELFEKHTNLLKNLKPN